MGIETQQSPVWVSKHYMRSDLCASGEGTEEIQGDKMIAALIMGAFMDNYLQLKV